MEFENWKNESRRARCFDSRTGLPYVKPSRESSIVNHLKKSKIQNTYTSQDVQCSMTNTYFPIMEGSNTAFTGARRYRMVRMRTVLLSAAKLLIGNHYKIPQGYLKSRVLSRPSGFAKHYRCPMRLNRVHMALRKDWRLSLILALYGKVFGVFFSRQWVITMVTPEGDCFLLWMQLIFQYTLSLTVIFLFDDFVGIIEHHRMRI